MQGIVCTFAQSDQHLCVDQCLECILIIIIASDILILTYVYIPKPWRQVYSQCWLTLFRPVEFSIKFGTVKSGWYIVYIEGFQDIMCFLISEH